MMSELKSEKTIDFQFKHSTCNNWKNGIKSRFQVNEMVNCNLIKRITQ